MTIFHIVMLIVITILGTMYHLSVRKLRLTDEENIKEYESITMYRKTV